MSASAPASRARSPSPRAASAGTARAASSMTFWPGAASARYILGHNARGGSCLRGFDGYVRVSQTRGREGPSFISLEVQRDSIQRWAEANGVEILAWHTD